MKYCLSYKWYWDNLIDIQKKMKCTPTSHQMQKSTQNWMQAWLWNKTTYSRENRGTNVYSYRYRYVYEGMCGCEMLEN